MTVRLPINLVLRVDAVAEAEGITTTAFVERALEAALAARARKR